MSFLRMNEQNVGETIILKPVLYLSVSYKKHQNVFRNKVILFKRMLNIQTNAK